MTLCINSEKEKFVCRFFCAILYNYVEIGGVTMNEFEQNVQSKRNDAIDSGVGFVVSFGFFTIMFVIAVVIEFLAR